MVDASVVAKWFVPEALSDQAVRLLEGEHELACPDLLWPELGSIVWKKSRKGEITQPEASQILVAANACPLVGFPSRLVLPAALEIAFGTGRSVYDSVYLALAVALEGRLATADERMTNALADTPLAPHVAWIGAPGWAG